MYVSMYVCMFVCVSTRMHAILMALGMEGNSRIYVCIYVSMHVCMFLCMSTKIYAIPMVVRCVCLSLALYMQMCVYVHTCMYVYIYIYIYMSCTCKLILTLHTHRTDDQKRPGITNSVATHLFSDNIVTAAPGFNAGMGRHIRAQQYADWHRNWQTVRTRNEKGESIHVG
jgi:hypothetical protein